MNVKVSIIIPFYNRESMVENCIKSVQRQSLKELEILCIDDGSTDAGSDKVREMCQKDHRIKLVAQDNAGAGAARNNGLRIAKGEFIAFLDSDDLYEDENALLKMVAACEKQAVPVCGARVHWKYGDAVSEYTNADCFSRPFDAEGEWISFRDYQNDMGYCGFIYRREFLQSHHIAFPNYREYEDPVFFMRVMKYAKGFWFVPVYLLGVRVWEHGRDDRREYAIVDILSGIRENLKIAAEGHYEKLFGKIISNISMEYRIAIINGMSDEILLSLLEINRINRESGYNFEMTILSDIYRAIHNVVLYRKSDARHIPHMIQTQMENIGTANFQDYFMKKGLSRVIMYGAGNYGNAFYCLARKCGLNIVAVIDREAKMWDDMCVLNPEEKWPDADATIVTLHVYENVVKEIKANKGGCVLSFIEMLNELEKMGKLI